MWSLGCTAIELFINTPIFPGKYDYDQMLKIIEFCGLPSAEMIHNSINRDRFFTFDQFTQQYSLKTFDEFLMTSVPYNMQQGINSPQRYHPFLNFGQLLEQWHIQKLRMQHAETLERKGFKINNLNEVPLTYGIEERLKIFQFIDFVQ
jgi:hypothetical protein